MRNLKKAKKLSLIIVFVMILQLSMPMTFAGAQTMAEQELSLDNDFAGTTTGAAIQAEGDKPSVLSVGNNLGNIFTFDYLKLGGKDGTDIKDDQIINIVDGTEVALQFKWDTVDKEAKAGDYAAIQLSNLFKAVVVSGQPLYITGSDEPVGTYSITNGELKLDFNDKIEGSTVKDGFVGFSLKFDSKEFMEDVEQEIKFNDSKGTTLNVIAEPRGEIKSIEKKGVPDSYLDAKKITWTIDVLNDGKTIIEDAKVTDKIPDGLELVKESFIVNELVLGYEGKKSVGGDFPVNPTIPGLDGADFEIGFNSIAPYKGYRVQYETKIKDYTMTEFTNDASFKYADKNFPANSTVSGITRSNNIEKTGSYLKDADLIEWTIDVNKSGSIIENAGVHEDLPQGLEIVSDSIEVYKITQSGDYWNTVGEPDKRHKEFPIALGNLVESDAYRIKFKTSIDYSLVNEGKYQKSNSFTNKTILKDGEIEVDNAETTVTFDRKSILRKEGKSNVSYDPTTKILTWTVHVNEANHPIKNAVVEDILPSGLSIENSDITVYNAQGTNITSNLADSDITITPLVEGETNVTINLGNIDTEYRKIVYTTTIENFTIDEFKNSASLKGDGIGNEGGTIDPVPVTPPKNSFSKSSTSINYNEKTITWQLTINPIREPITELKIVDTFPNKGLILLIDEPNQLVVSKGSTTLVKDTHYTLEPNKVTVDGVEVTGYHKGFILTFIGEGLPINANTTITYKTSYDPDVVVGGNKLEPNTDTATSRKYKNNANFIGKTSSSVFNEDKPAERQVIVSSWNSGKKSGKLISIDGENNTVNGWISGNKRQIQWEVYINYLKQNLGSGVTVTDTLAYNGVIDLNSIEVKTYNVNENNGNTSIPTNSTKVDKDNYSVKYGGDENNPVKNSFILTFKGDFLVNERYVIIFKTSVPDISIEDYTNKAITQFTGGKHEYTGTVSHNVYNKFLYKESNASGNVYTGDEVNWTVTVNESLSVIKNAEINDTISDGLIYVNDSLKVYKKLSGTNKELSKDDYTFSGPTVSEETGKTTINITFKNDVDYTVILEYKTVVTATSGIVSNEVVFEGTGIDKQSVPKSELSASQFSWAGGTLDPNKGKLVITKVDAEEKDSDDKNKVISNNEAGFSLWYKINDVSYQFGGEGKIFETVNGVLTIGNLPLRTYYLREETAPDGYIKLENEVTITVDKAINNNEANTVKLTVENTKIKTSVTAIKTWINGPTPRPTIHLQLYRDNVEHGDPVEFTDGETIHTWNNLDKTDIDGKEYVYTVDEVNVPTNYVKSISEDGLTAINTYVSPKTQITGTKVWVGGPTERPSIKLQLYRNGEELGEPVELKDGTLTYTWSNLDKTDENGKVYEYSIDEVETLPNYGKSISNDKLTVTNTYASPKDDIIGRKVWVGGPKPSIQLQLYRQIAGEDKEAVGIPITLESGVYEHKWESQDKTDSNGREYTYTVEEIGVPVNYTKAEEGLTVTNTYIIPKTQVTGTKEWVGGPVRKPTVQLQLYRDKEVFGLPVTLESGTTSYTWEDLDETDIDGNRYVYTVDEVEIPSRYRKSISEDGLTIINTYRPTRPTDPVDPKPEEPENPVNPVNPEEPKKPEEPETPVVEPDDKFGSILINKLDLDSNPLEGAEFTLYDANGAAIRTVTSDVNGTVLFNNLPLGIYSVAETKAPDGYELFDDDLMVDLRDAKTLKYNFRNVPTDTEIEDPNIPSGWEEINDPDVPVDTTAPTLPNTGYIFNTWMLAAIGFIFIFTGMVLFKRRVRN